MDQPTPTVSRADVERIVRRDYPPEDFGRILNALDAYGIETYEHEKARVQLAVLKLANGDEKELLRALNIAKCDYRDVLAAAEYPGYPWNAAKLSPLKQEEIVKADWRQYSDWLSR